MSEAASVQTPKAIPETTNDPSNDQPLGTVGNATIRVTNASSGNTYDLDGYVVSRGDISVLATLFFPKGGNVDFSYCPLNITDQQCIDESGSSWTIHALNFRG